MPGPRLEIAELFILHLIHLNIDFHYLIGRIAVIYGYVVSRPVSKWARHDWNPALTEYVTGCLDMSHVPQFEGKMTQMKTVTANKVHCMMIGVAP